jgi:hypothetical protein
MTRIHGVMIALLLSVQVVFPAAASARVSDQDDASMSQSRFERPRPVLAAADAQTSPVQKRPSAGGRLLRNTLIGAAIGATVLGTLAGSSGDCGRCPGERGKAILAGAMYGALFGAAIRIHPSQRRSASLPPHETTINPQLTKEVKAVNVAVRF